MKVKNLLNWLLFWTILPFFAILLYLSGSDLVDEGVLVRSKAVNRLQNAELVISEHVEQHARALTLLASTPLLNNPDRLDLFYEQALNFKKHFGSDIVLADMSKQMLLHTRSPLGSKLPVLPIPEGRSSVTQALATGKLAVGDVFYGPVAKTPLVSMAIPVIKNNKTIYILVTTMPLKHFQDMITIFKVPYEWQIKLIDSTGAIIASNAGQAEDDLNSTFEGFNDVIPVRGTPWSLTLRIPALAYFYNTIHIFFSMLLAIFAALIIALVGGQKIARKLSLELEGLLHSQHSSPSNVRVDEIENIRKRIFTSQRDLESALLGTLTTLGNTMEKRDPYTSGHERRVGSIARNIAIEMNLDPERIRGLELIGMMHDIGKISVPAEILSNPGLLSEAQYSIIKEHAQSGYDIIKDVKFPWPVAETILQHHERFDGSGYPQGLKGEEINLEARIISVSDVVEAMSSHRPYRPGLGIEAALSEVEKYSGKLYDPDVVAACLRLFREKNYQIPS